MTERIFDVYTHVARMVEKVIAEDMRIGNKHAIALSGKISRKVVKQTVSPYHSYSFGCVS